METVDGLVTAGNSGTSDYSVRYKGVNSLLLENRYCPSRDMIGKWIRMKVDRNQICGNVTIIEDVFHTRVEKGLAEVEVVFRHDGNYKKDNFEVFSHDYFGLIADPYHLVPRIDPKDWFTAWIVPYKHNFLGFRWRVSKAPSAIEPQYTQPENEVAIVQGIVHDHIDQYYLVWSATFPKKSIRVKGSICPPVDMLGRWVEMEVEGHNFVRKVEIIKEIFETQFQRLRGVQVRVEFEHVERYDNMEMFHHNYFKNIWDSQNVLENVERKARYRGWIVHYEQGLSTGWRLATDPAPEGPLRDGRQGQSPSRISDSNRFERDDERRNFSRTASPENVDRRRSLSPAGRGYSNCNNLTVPHIRRRSRSVGRQYSERVTRFPEDVENRTRRSDSGNRNFSSDYQRSSVPSPYQDSSSPHIYDLQEPSRATKPNFLADNTTRSQLETNERALSENLGVPRDRPLKVQRSEQETQILELKMKLERIGEILAFFCKNKQIRKAIVSMDIEQYHELIELTTIDDE